MRDEDTIRDHVGSLEKGLAVMEILARQPFGMTLTEMAAEAGLTRAGARRFLLTLTATGYATQAGRRFTLSAKLLAVAHMWLGETSLWDHALPFMGQTAAALRESCSAAVLSGEDIVYVARVAGPRIINLDLDVGAHLPAYCTAMGRVLLSGLKPEELDAFLGRVSITRNTDKTLTDPRLIAQAIATARQDGYAMVDEELEMGLRSIAVPVHDRSGAIVAAVNVSTQPMRCSVVEMERDFLPPLRRTAMRIEDFFVR